MCQIMEAKQFNQCHASLIAETEEALATEIQKFLETPESISVLDPSFRSVAKASINLGKFGTAARIIRSYAGEFCSSLSSKGRERYWSLIEAFDFLQDATGTRWAYMTQEKRSTALQWASDALRFLQGSETDSITSTRTPEVVA